MYKISPSQFQSHRDCSQAHLYAYGQNLRSKQGQKKFLVGSYFHELAHFYYQLVKAGYKAGDKQTFVAMDAKMRSDLEIIKIELVAIAAQVHLMFRRYLDRQTQYIDRNIEVLEVEKELQVSLGDDIIIHGISDLIYRHKGKTIIRDHKTGERKASYSAEGMDYEDQLWVYACIWYQLTGEVPIIEISWINSKVDYKDEPSNEQLYGIFRKEITKSQLEAYWTYVQEYVHHMQSVPAVRHINSYRCKNCTFKDICLFELRGLDTGNIREANFIEVPRGYDYQKFTEIASRANSGSNTISLGGNNPVSEWTVDIVING